MTEASLLESKIIAGKNAKLEAVLAHQGLKTLEVFFLKKITLGNALQISKKSMQFYPRLYGGIR